MNFKRCERDRPEGTYKYRHIEFDSIICESASTRPLRPVIKTGIFADISEKHSILRHQPNQNERNFWGFTKITLDVASPSSAAFSNGGCHRVAECILMSARQEKGLDAFGCPNGVSRRHSPSEATAYELEATSSPRCCASVTCSPPGVTPMRNWEQVQCRQQLLTGR